MGARIGLDLGTTNSAPALLYDDGPHLIPRGRGTLVPSVVFYRWGTGEDDVLVGSEADNTIHERVVRSVKRLMGRTYDKALDEGAERYFVEGTLRRRLRNDLVLVLEDDEGEEHELWPHEVSARILAFVKEQAEAGLGAPVEKAVVTVPAYFEDPHRAATLEAARLAGLEVWEPLLDEPTAAALAFGRAVGIGAEEPLLVVDWGGGTFDVTLLASHGEEWVQLGIGGDLNLGGDDIDRALAALALETAGFELDWLEDKRAFHALVREARRVKHRLSRAEEATFGCVLPAAAGSGARPLSTLVRRADLEEQVEPLVERGLRTIEPCVASAGVDLADIGKILLVGGSTRLPLLRKKLGELCPRARLHDEIDPMLAVALGAAVYASQERPDVVRLCPYGYAVRDGDELVEIVPPNMTVPTPPELPFRAPYPLRTSYDGQTVYRVQLHRYTRHAGGLKNVAGVAHERVFARGMPPSPEGSAVGLELWLDENKVLRARIVPPSGPPREVVASSTEIGRNAVRTMLQDRMLEVEALVEANRENGGALLENLRRALEEAETALEGGEPEACEEALRAIDERLELARTDRSPSPVRERVLGWASFYERQLLPAFWHLFEPERRDELVRRLRAIRVMEETLASDEELEAELRAFEAEAFAESEGLLLRAFRDAHVVGVPSALSDELADLALAAARARLQGRAEAYRELREAVGEKLAEANARRREWLQAGEVRLASPDLRVDPARRRTKG